MTNRERSENRLFKTLEEAPEKAITAICLVISAEEAERILKRERTKILNEIHSLLKRISKQTDSLAIELRPKISELTEVINRLISER